MKIKIIAGTFGHRIGERVVPIRPGYDPIEVSDFVGARLVRLGVAEEIESEPSEVQTVEEGGEAAVSEAFPAYDASMTRAQLESIALSIGIEEDELKAAGKKADVLALLDSAKADREAEDAPTFDPAGDML